MATALENLTTARDNVAAVLAQITASPKPTYSVEGKSVSWESYFSALVSRLEDLDRAILRLGGPYELQTQAIP